MIFEYCMVVLAAACVVLTALHVPTWHRQYRAFLAWKATGFDVTSGARADFHRLHARETWISMGVMLCFGSAFLMATVLAHNVLPVHIPDPRVLVYSAWVAGASFFVSLAAVTYYKRLIGSMCACCNCKSTMV